MQKLTPIYDVAHAFCEKTDKSIFLTGKAGTGKTTFLKNFRLSTHKQIAITAPTGVAAINAEGVTIHSFFQLPFTPFIPTAEGRHDLIHKIKMTHTRRKVLQALEILVIDEVSMVRADLLDEVDTVLRHFRYRPSEPFGGVQVVFIGDLYQLPPVVSNEEWILLSQYYESPYFFASRVIREYPPIYVELDKIFRQKNTEFVRLLNEVRNNELSMHGLHLLQSRYDPNFKLEEHPDYVFLTTHNYIANRINKEELNKLQGSTYRYEAKVYGDFLEKNFPTEEVLELRMGAKVMFVANDISFGHRYYNGKMGTITRLDENHIYVQCEDDEDEISVALETWKNIRYGVNKQTGQIEEEELGSYTQFPLRLAWAITIHKSQGLTFDKAVIDAAYAFSSGQVYVALSRCKSLEGLVLTSLIPVDKCRVEEPVVAYSKNKTSIAQLQHILSISEQEYQEKIILNIFDFKFIIGLMQHIGHILTRSASKVNNEGIRHAALLEQDLMSLKKVADTFQKQAHQLFHSPQKLEERLKAAAVYFEEQLKTHCCNLSSSPAEIYDRELAREYRENCQMLFAELSLKSHLIKGLHSNLTLDEFYKLKDEFRVPSFSFKRTSAFDKMFDKKPEKKVVKEVRKVSYRITCDAFIAGQTVEAIAQDRDMSVRTIEQHLVRGIQEGLLDTTNLIEPAFKTAIEELLEHDISTADIFDAMEGNVTYNQIKMVRAEQQYKARGHERDV